MLMSWPMIIGFGLVSNFNEIFLSPILAKGGGAPWCWPETSETRWPVRAIKENTPKNNVHKIFVTILSKAQIDLTMNKLWMEHILISMFVHRNVG